MVFKRLTLEQAMAQRLATDAMVAAVRSMAEAGVAPEAAVQACKAAAVNAATAAAAPDVPMPPSRALTRDIPAREGFPGAQYRCGVVPSPHAFGGAPGGRTVGLDPLLCDLKPSAHVPSSFVAPWWPHGTCSAWSTYSAATVVRRRVACTN